MRNSKRNLLLLLLFVVLVSAGIDFTVRALRAVYVAHERFGVVWQTHDMLTRYVKDHDGQWPRNWDDLKQSFDETNQGYGAPSFEWLSDRIEVDFDFDRDSVASTEQAADHAFQVLRLPDVENTRETREANERLRTLVRSYRN